MTNIDNFPTSRKPISLDDGTRDVVLNNKYGKELGRLIFKFADVSLFGRYEVLQKDFDGMMKQVAKLNLGNSGDASFKKDWENLKKVENTLREKLNNFLDADDDPFGTIFKNCNPFSSVGGRFFIEQLMEVIGGVVAEEFQTEAKLSAERMAKHLKDIEGDADVGSAAGEA